MKVFSFLLLILSTMPAIHAEANGLPPSELRLKFVQENGKRLDAVSMPIVGRGTSNVRTQESIALACVDINNEKCKKLAWIYFSQAGEAFELGIPIEMAHEEALSSPQVKALVKAQMRAFKQTERNNRLWDSVTGRKDPTLWVVGSYALSLLVVGMNPVGITVVTGAALTASAVMLVRGGELGDFLLSANSKANQAFYDQNGWNWSITPKKLSESKFNHFFESISGPIVTLEISGQ